MLRGPVSLSRNAWEAVRNRYGVAEQHRMLSFSPDPVSAEEFPAWERRAFEELNRTGLANGTTVHQDLLDSMQLLAMPPVEVHGRVGYHNRNAIGFVAAGEANGGVLAVLDEQALHLRPIGPDKLVEAAVGLLPPAPPGRGQSLSMPVADADRVAGGGQQASAGNEEQGWLQSSSGDSDTTGRALQRLLTEPRLGGGRFYAALRDATGRRRRSAEPLTYMDLESGRWLVRKKPNASGELWMVIQPASPEVLAGGVGELLRELH
ncbi:ESX secretion-associated protein EspG [Kutzneria albida]|uniref:ESX secretion-associated protein EspG n=1 Tax=Kutzneria albida DSM 43870 TaxID=1449976 RepID=W5W639_9PSEU|nr:ESX secretion-associated protein EspG [Kutzneria albida]AHH93624.1 hypothetical protein KALB_247 [Kutzneria albida DSM 43870]